MSGIRLLDCSKLAVCWKNFNEVSIFGHDVSVKFFDVVSLVKFCYWPKFHVNIIADPGVMTIPFYKGSTRNPKIGSTPNIVRLG